MRILLLTLLLCPILLLSQLPAPLHNTYVHDYARALTAEQVELLNRQIITIDTAYKAKITIVLLNELPGSYSIEDYARDIGNKWHAGKGVVYVAAINQRKQRLEVSAHLEGVITDATALHITDRIKPHFKSKDYYSGLTGMIVEVAVLLKADAVLQSQRKTKIDTGKKEWSIVVLIIGLLTGLIGVAVYFIYRERRRDRKFKEMVRQEKERIDSIVKPEKPPIYKTAISAHTHHKGKTITEHYTPPPVIYTPPTSGNNDTSSRRSNDNNYGGYDSGSSSSSSDSYGGGGSTNDW